MSEYEKLRKLVKEISESNVEGWKTAEVYAKIPEKIKREIKELKQRISMSNESYYSGYMCALSVCEGIIAAVEKQAREELEK